MSKEALAALRQGKLSRRDLNRALAAVGLSFAVMPLTARSGRAAGNLTFFTWGGYDVPEAAPQYGASDPEATFAAPSIAPEPDEPYRSKHIELVNNVKAGL